MKFSKGIALIIILTLLMSSMMAFAEGKTDQEIAEALNGVNLIAGDGTGYNLDGQLTRAEAATFIVKLLGQEKDVLERKAMYVMSNFPDIKGDEWYAPYIGYCERNSILSGFPDGTVRANDPLSEKAFFTMVLKALGYTSDDFNWNNVNGFAYQVGLTMDSSYANKTSDSTTYLRGSVVGVMYNSLNLPRENDSTTFIGNLIDTKITTEDKANQLGLIKTDELISDIKSIVANSSTELKIVFNEAPKELAKEQLLITNKSTKSNLTVTDLTLDGVNAIITTSSQADNVAYNLSVTNFKDEQNFVISELNHDFRGYTVPIISSNYFVVSKIVPVSVDRVDVYFTHPINSAAILPLNYSIYNGSTEFIKGGFDTLETSLVSGVDNAVSLKLKTGKFDGSVVYTLKIKGTTTSAYSSKLNNGTETSKDFGVSVEPNVALGIISVEQINENHVRVIFDKPVDKTTASQATNYKLKDTTSNFEYNNAFAIVFTGEGELENRQIDVKWLPFKVNHEYELTIKNIEDSLNSSTLSESAYPFAGKDYTEDPFRIEYASAYNSNLIKVFFTRQIRSTSVNATVTGVSKNVVTFDENNPYVLNVYLNSASSLVEGTEYNLQFVTGITDVYGNTYQNISFKVQGINFAYPDTIIESAVAISKNQIKLEFDKEVSTSNSASKFKLEYMEEDKKKTISTSSISFVDSKTAILTYADNFDQAYYTLVVSNLTDVSNQFTTTDIKIDVAPE